MPRNHKSPGTRNPGSFQTAGDDEPVLGISQYPSCAKFTPRRQGYEQANKYLITDQNQQTLAFMAEEELGLMAVLARQLFRTHRSFRTTVMDPHGQVLLRFHRPFSWINSRISVMNGSNERLGEVHQRWHLWRRRYDMFLGYRQFAEIDAGFLAWNFQLLDEQGRQIAQVDRQFRGFARELFTDTGQYVLSFSPPARTSLEQRAIALGAAITIDFDYFSHHSGHSSYGGFSLFNHGGE